MAENSSQEMSRIHRSPDRRQSKEAHYPPYPTRFESALSRWDRCLLGFARLPRELPSAPSKGRGCCHLVQWSENEKRRYSRSPEGSWDHSNHYRFWELPYAAQPPKWEPLEGRCHRDRGSWCCCGTESTN